MWFLTPRTRVNTNEKAKRSTAEQIRRKIPAVVPTVEDCEEKQAELDALRENHSRRKTKAQGDAEAAMSHIAYELKIKRENFIQIWNKTYYI